MPTFIVTRKFLNFEYFKFIRKKNYLFGTLFIPWRLYFLNISFFRTKRLIGKFENYNVFDLSPQINEELFYLIQAQGSIVYWISVFWKNYQKNKIKKITCLLENQPDKVWSYAINKYFPNIQNVGYQGFSDIPQQWILFHHFMRVIMGFYQKIITIGKAYKKSDANF